MPLHPCPVSVDLAVLAIYFTASGTSRVHSADAARKVHENGFAAGCLGVVEGFAGALRNSKRRSATRGGHKTDGSFGCSRCDRTVNTLRVHWAPARCCCSMPSPYPYCLAGRCRRSAEIGAPLPCGHNASNAVRSSWLSPRRTSRRRWNRTWCFTGREPIHLLCNTFRSNPRCLVSVKLQVSEIDLAVDGLARASRTVAPACPVAVTSP
jgi:hypothetical protein